MNMSFTSLFVLATDPHVSLIVTRPFKLAGATQTITIKYTEL
jgi:hypothetical protein